jgi:hypothetical protein
VARLEIYGTTITAVDEDTGEITSNVAVSGIGARSPGNPLPLMQTTSMAAEGGRGTAINVFIVNDEPPLLKVSAEGFEAVEVRIKPHSSDTMRVPLKRVRK